MMRLPCLPCYGIIMIHYVDDVIVLGINLLLCCCRHPVAGAAAHARHQQKDGRGAEGYLRLLGEGATAPRRAKR